MWCRLEFVGQLFLKTDIPSWSHWVLGHFCEVERLSFSAHRWDNGGFGEQVGWETETLTPGTLFPRLAGAGWLGLAGVLIWYRLYSWHTDTFTLGDCHCQQFFAWIDCPQSESPNGCDTVFRCDDLRPHSSRGNPFRSPTSADLKKPAGKQPWTVNGLFYLTGKMCSFSEMSLYFWLIPSKVHLP